MTIESDARRSGYGGALFAILVIALVGYFAFAGLQGEHGLFRLHRIEAQERRLTEELAALRAEREALANKTLRLSDRYLDPDLLDERARKVLGLGRPDEILIR
jgi:cell division protein FtsB